jgi:diguanylate cyclase (GGDEF)-like protein
MKTLLFSMGHQDTDSKRTERSLALYLLPESFPKWAGITLLSFAAAWAGVALGQAVSAGADILWPANGLVLAFLLRSSRRYWFAYLAGSVIANIAAHEIYGFPIYQVLLFSAANVIEILIAAALLSRRSPQSLNLTQLADLVRFGFFAVLFAPLCSTAFVDLVLAGLGRPPGGLVFLVDMYVGDALGIAIMTPMFLAMEQCELTALFGKAKRVETVSILLGIGALSLLVFTLQQQALVFLLFSVLLLAIFRLGSSGSAIALFLMVIPGAYFTAQRQGPFAPSPTGSITQSIFQLQSFVGIALVTIYLVSAALTRRDRVADALTVAYQEADANAATDHVTGLANRRAFDQKLAQEWRRAVRDRAVISLIMIDVDQFKLYNDYYGHLAGDACLRTIGEILGGAPLRETDLAARYGGEEFAILLPRAGSEGAAMLAEKIRQSIADRHIPHLPYQPGIVTLSMGVATIRATDGLDELMLIEKADQALYQAKKEGRNQVKLWDGAHSS